MTRLTKNQITSSDLPESGDSPPLAHSSQEASWLMWLPYLYFRPQKFLDRFLRQPCPLCTILLAWLVGVNGAIDRIESRAIINAGEPAMESFMRSWQLYWAVAAIAGIPLGAFSYGIGGWWYRLRIRWCGVSNPDRWLARRIYVHTWQAQALPSLLYVGWTTLVYSDPGASINGDDLIGFLVIVPMYWAIYVSYRCLRAAFPIRAWLARLWFLVLPVILLSIVLGIAMSIGIFLGLEERPDVGNPREIHRSAFSLSYPGNWVIDTKDDDYNPDGFFAIEPLMDDALIQFSFYQEGMDSRECADNSLAGLAEAHELSNLEPIFRWGDRYGSGTRAMLMIEGIPFRLLVFCDVENELPFEVLQLCEESICDKVEPGFQLIRESFQVRTEDEYSDDVMTPSALNT